MITVNHHKYYVKVILSVAFEAVALEPGVRIDHDSVFIESGN